MSGTSRGINCARCDGPAPEGARFCAQCGAPLQRDAAAAELRQLTVLFCDLVGSTAMADALDPEDLRDVMRDYHAVCAEVVARLDGHIAQYLGDGVLVYFGDPAHEDDVRRAIQAALDIVSGVARLETRLRATRQLTLNVRLGVHTGPVVVGDIGVGAGRERLALGLTPNVAARLQTLGPPGAVLVSEVTERLASGYFLFEPLGPHDIQGLAQPFVVHRVLRPSGAESGLDARRQSGGLTALTGRAGEIATLRERWQAIQEERLPGSTVVIRGEAGIGKSRLVAGIREYVQDHGFTTMETACSPRFQDSMLYPIARMIERALAFNRDWSAAQKWSAIERWVERYGVGSANPTWLIGKLLAVPPPGEVVPPALSPQQEHDATMGVLRAWWLAVAREGPALVVVEDVHWADPTTLELLRAIADGPWQVPLLMVLTVRSEAIAPLDEGERVSWLSIGRLGGEDTAAMIARVAGNKSLPDEVLAQLIARTEGIPLFVEEVTKAVLELGVLVEAADRYELAGPLPPGVIPVSMQASLLARLDRLGSAKSIAQLAAIIGREFRLDLLRVIADVEETALRAAIARLQEAELILPLGTPDESTFIFKHALIQDAAYQSLLKRTRRDQHRRIAETLIERFPAIAEHTPELVAQHFAAGDDPAQALACWRRAGQSAAVRGALHETVAHARRALEQLARLPESRERDEQELECNMLLTPALQMTQGWATAEIDRTFRRSGDLAERLGDSPHAATVLASSFAFHLMRGHLREALTLSRRVRDRAAGTPAALQAIGHGSCCVAELYGGDIGAAIASARTALALITPEAGQALLQITGMSGEMYISCYLSEALWMAGYPEQALRTSVRSVALAREIAHRPSEEFAVSYQAQFYHLFGDAERILAVADESFRLTEAAQSVFWRPLVATYQGWAMTARGDVEAGLALMQDALARYRAAGNGLTQIHVLSLIADGLVLAERWDEALGVLDDATRLAATTGETYFEPELSRLRGEIQRRLAAGAPAHERAARLATAAASFREALVSARRSGAKSLALRAATGLCLVQRDGGAADDGAPVLTALLQSFTEGFDTPDLRLARALAEQFGGAEG